jgi:hypothetical protein
MSADHEEAALVEALRDDLPSPETSTRLRRRLLGAGLAIGHGAVAGGALAAGSAPGVVAKGVALSWGFKLGALAVVAIPSVGLLVESSSSPQLSPPPPAAVHTSPAREPHRAAPAPAAAPAPSPPQEAEDLAGPETQRPATLLARPSGPELGPGSAPDGRRPSQAEFRGAEAAEPSRLPSTLAEETPLLDGAFAALSARDAARATALIAEHERRFPQGLLQKERERAKARLRELSRVE